MTKNNTPLIQSKELQNFYPVETVAAVVKIKSALSKKELKYALEKLSKVKTLRKSVKGLTLIRRAWR